MKADNRNTSHLMTRAFAATRRAPRALASHRSGAWIMLAWVMLVSSPAFAQNLESKVQSLGNLVINILSVVAVLVGTAASLIAGMKYMGGDPHAREQVKGIAIGAFFAFAAAGIVQAMRGALA